MRSPCSAGRSARQSVRPRNGQCGVPCVCRAYEVWSARFWCPRPSSSRARIFLTSAAEWTGSVPARTRSGTSIAREESSGSSRPRSIISRGENALLRPVCETSTSSRCFVSGIGRIEVAMSSSPFGNGLSDGPGTVSTFRSFDTLRPFDTLRQAQGPSSGHRKLNGLSSGVSKRVRPCRVPPVRRFSPYRALIATAPPPTAPSTARARPRSRPPRPPVAPAVPRGRRDRLPRCAGS